MTLRQRIDEFIDKNPEFHGPNMSAIVNSMADYIDTLEARLSALETWKRPRSIKERIGALETRLKGILAQVEQWPSPTNEAVMPSDEGAATSIPPKKGENGWLVTPGRWQVEEPRIMELLAKGEFMAARQIILKGLEEENRVAHPAVREVMADDIMKSYRE